MIVYDITDKKSYDDVLNFWVPQVLENCNDLPIELLILGNKVDLNNDRAVPKDISEKEFK